MKKVYMYNNAIIYITIHNNSHKNIQKSTEKFMKKVLKEKINNDNSKGHNIREK